MSEYYQVSATLPAPPSRGGQPKSTHPHVGVRSNKDPPTTSPTAAARDTPPSDKSASPDLDWPPEQRQPVHNPEWQQPPPPVQQQHPPPSVTTWRPYETKSGPPSAPPPYSENNEKAPLEPPTRSAPANREQEDRRESCRRILKRLLPIALLFSYTLLGGVIFHMTESRAQPESEILKGHRVLIDQPPALQLEKRMTEIVLDRNYTRDRRRYEVREALLWYLRQLNEEEKARWDFASALFYSMTLYTTIGK